MAGRCQTNARGYDGSPAWFDEEAAYLYTRSRAFAIRAEVDAKKAEEAWGGALALAEAEEVAWRRRRMQMPK